MLSPFSQLLLLLGSGALAGVALIPRVERGEAARAARIFLLVVAGCLSVRALAYIVANVFTLRAVRPLSTGPGDLTNLPLGALYLFAVAAFARRRLRALLREADVVWAVRLATGVAFILA